MYCSNNCCKCKNHLSQMDNLFYSIIQCCIKASLYTIPQKGHTDKKCSITPGWTDSIQPLKNKAIFWHSVWKDCHRPRDGWIFKYT